MLEDFININTHCTLHFCQNTLPKYYTMFSRETIRMEIEEQIKQLLILKYNQTKPHERCDILPVSHLVSCWFETTTTQTTILNNTILKNLTSFTSGKKSLFMDLSNSTSPGTGFLTCLAGQN